MRRNSILTVFGTRPEIIKLAPLMLALERHHRSVRTINVCSGQHEELLYPFVDFFDVRMDYDLRLKADGQGRTELLERIVLGLSEIIAAEKPNLLVVQGDTTTALAGAIAGSQCGVPVAHVEAGLRSGNLRSPYPEEAYRIAITRMASIHFAATERNKQTLRREGVSDKAIFVTGNPIVDTLQMVLRERALSTDSNAELQKVIGDRKCIILTTHRRESFGPVLSDNLRVIRAFVERHEEVVVVFPVHPNPNVQTPAHEILGGHPRIFLIQPLAYFDFVQLVSKSWLVVSDSGGIQEEVPSLGKPLLILRENTERPECIDAGVAKLAGGRPGTLRTMLEEACLPDSWVNFVGKIENPFGCGDSGGRIANHIASLLRAERPRRTDSGRFIPTNYMDSLNADAQIQRTPQ